MAKRKGKISSGAIKSILVALVAVIVVAGAIFGITQIKNLGEKAVTSEIIPEPIDPESLLSPEERAYVGQIKRTYSRSPKLESIIANIDKYTPSMMKSLMLREEMIEYIEGFPTAEQKGFENAKNIDISDEYTKGKIPLFIQWDKRWGYETYGTDVFGLNGCGPTAMAMVYVGLTGDTSMNPLKMGEFCIDNGYYYDYQGTSNDLYNVGAGKLGLTVRQISVAGESVRENLQLGRPIIVHVLKGDFTSEGHFIVLTGIDSDGKIIINDPNSPKKSKKTWDLDRIIGQAASMWAFSK